MPSTMPAPPPNGMSSTCAPLSGECSRRSSTFRLDPAASAFATWRWEENQSNHSGNSVKSSISIRSLHPLAPPLVLQAEKRLIDLDPSRRERVRHVALGGKPVKPLG